MSHFNQARAASLTVSEMMMSVDLTPEEKTAAKVKHALACYDKLLGEAPELAPTTLSDFVTMNEFYCLQSAADVRTANFIF
jgi:hypothetical protein